MNYPTTPPTNFPTNPPTEPQVKSFCLIVYTVMYKFTRVLICHLFHIITAYEKSNLSANKLPYEPFYYSGKMCTDTGRISIPHFIISS